MIPLKFGLFWSGAKLSPLRFLTFVSLRKHHPDAEIQLYLSRKSTKSVNWESEKQDFQSNSDIKCCLDKLESLGVDIVKSELFPTYPPNYQSDLFRWWWMYNNGGFYLDTDQIILKPFNDLPLHVDLIYSMYKAKTCGIYSPVGVIGANIECPIVSDIMGKMSEHYDPKSYNSLDPYMFKDVYLENEAKWSKKHTMFNAPPHYFYPFAESKNIISAYKSRIHLTEESYALHWYGAHPKSQEFNSNFSEESCREDEDTISRLARPLFDWYNRR